MNKVETSAKAMLRNKQTLPNLFKCSKKKGCSKRKKDCRITISSRWCVQWTQHVMQPGARSREILGIHAKRTRRSQRTHSNLRRRANKTGNELIQQNLHSRRMMEPPLFWSRRGRRRRKLSAKPLWRKWCKWICKSTKPRWKAPYFAAFTYAPKANHCPVYLSRRQRPSMAATH